MLLCMLGTSIVQNSSMDPSMHCCMIFYLFIFLMVIVEVHKLILDVCVSLIATPANKPALALYGLPAQGP